MESNQLAVEPMHDQEHKLEQLQAALYRFCLSLTGSVHDAEDLSQQTWMKTIRRLAEHGHDNPEAFLLRVAKNAWIDECRRRKGLRDRLLWLSELGEHVPEREQPDVERAIAALMRYLSPIQRTVFLLRDTLDYSIAETAALLGTSEGAVKAALHRARRALADVREACRTDRGDAGRDEWLDAEAEELARRILNAYAEGRIDELIALVQSQPAGSNGLFVVGRYAQGAVGQLGAAPGRQAPMSHGMSPYGNQASNGYGKSPCGTQVLRAFGMTA